jgi:sodium-dependent dicarboxylate transporter 2/3/5
MAAVCAFVMVWWVTEAIPIPATALAGSALTVVLGIAGAQEALAPFASPTIFLFIGSFMLAQAISAHHLDRRLASGLLSMPGVRGHFARVRIALACLTMVLSAWMSNTATTAMLLPMVIGILATAEPGGSRPAHTRGFLLTIAYAASIGGMATPVGSPPNLITIGLLDRLAGVRIDFLTWMLIAVPITAAMGLATLAISTWLFTRGHQPHPAPTPAAAEQEERQPWTMGQRNCVFAFLVAVVLWILPGAVAFAGFREESWARTLSSRLDEGVVAVVAAGLLFVLPADWARRRFTLDWATASRIDWGTILLFGGGLSLGRLMFETGLAEHVGSGLVAVSGAESLWSVTAMSAAVAILLTEVTSNTAAANMLIPVIVTICRTAGLDPVPPALGAGLGASLAFMLPISTPPNAIVYGTGLVPVTAMIRFGVVLDLVGFVIVVAGLRVLCPLFGFG